MPRYNYDRDDDLDTRYPDAARVDGHPGIAWHVLGWHVESQWCDDVREEICYTCDGTGAGDNADCVDCEGCGSVRIHAGDYDDIRTGDLVCVMIGDDAHWRFDPSDVTPLDREAYCGECGQIGCGHDGLDRD